jgi:hypothetical protein
VSPELFCQQQQQRQHGCLQQLHVSYLCQQPRRQSSASFQSINSMKRSSTVEPSSSTTPSLSSLPQAPTSSAFSLGSDAFLILMHQCTFVSLIASRVASVAHFPDLSLPSASRAARARACPAVPCHTRGHPPAGARSPPLRCAGKQHFSDCRWPPYVSSAGAASLSLCAFDRVDKVYWVFTGCAK